MEAQPSKFEHDTSPYKMKYQLLLSQLEKMNGYYTIAQIEYMFLRLDVRQKNWKNKIYESFSEFKALKIQFDKHIEGKSDLSLEILDI